MPPARLLELEEIAEALLTVPLWTLSADGRAIGRELKFADFTAAFAFMTAAAIEAQVLDHHPDWSNSYNTVTITLTGHWVGGLTDLDFALARRMDVRALGGH